jgi:phosphoglycolate phosphatase-like HAD superfamily hydrolase
MINKFIIFDLDDTLVNFMEHYNVAFSETFKEIYGINSNLDEIDFAGKTIPNIIRELGELKGIEQELIEKRLDNALDCIADKFFISINEINNADKYTLPGVNELLKELVNLGFVIGLMTGSTSKISRKILKVTDLLKYFDILTFGEEAKDRDGLLRKSLEKARKKFGIEFTKKSVIMIGDSIRDIECGKKISALVIAVATGYHSYDVLKEHNPDYIFNSLRNYKELAEIIVGD